MYHFHIGWTSVKFDQDSDRRIGAIGLGGNSTINLTFVNISNITEDKIYIGRQDTIELVDQFDGLIDIALELWGLFIEFLVKGLL